MAWLFALAAGIALSEFGLEHTTFFAFSFFFLLLSSSSIEEVTFHFPVNVYCHWALTSYVINLLLTCKGLQDGNWTFRVGLYCH